MNPEYKLRAYLRIDGNEMRVIGVAINGQNDPDQDIEELFKEDFRDNWREKDTGQTFYVWSLISREVAKFFCSFEDFFSIQSARQSQTDPTSGFFIHEGVLYLSTESEALAARIAADEQRELSALLGEVGSKSKGGRL